MRFHLLALFSFALLASAETEDDAIPSDSPVSDVVPSSELLSEDGYPSSIEDVSPIVETPERTSKITLITRAMFITAVIASIPPFLRQLNPVKYGNARYALMRSIMDVHYSIRRAVKLRKSS